jgi:hypothetical protein
MRFLGLTRSRTAYWSPFGAKFSQLLSQVLAGSGLLAVDEQANGLHTRQHYSRSCQISCQNRSRCSSARSHFIHQAMQNPRLFANPNTDVPRDVLLSASATDRMSLRYDYGVLRDVARQSTRSIGLRNRWTIQNDFVAEARAASLRRRGVKFLGISVSTWSGLARNTYLGDVRLKAAK